MSCSFRGQDLFDVLLLMIGYRRSRNLRSRLVTAASGAPEPDFPDAPGGDIRRHRPGRAPRARDEQTVSLDHASHSRVTVRGQTWGGGEFAGMP